MTAAPSSHRQSDPTEQNDLSQQNPDVLKKLRERLDRAVGVARDVGKLFEGSGELELSEEELEVLRALGYVGTGKAPGENGPRK